MCRCRAFNGCQWFRCLTVIQCPAVRCWEKGVAWCSYQQQTALCCDRYCRCLVAGLLKSTLQQHMFFNPGPLFSTFRGWLCGTFWFCTSLNRLLCPPLQPTSSLKKTTSACRKLRCRRLIRFHLSPEHTYGTNERTNACRKPACHPTRLQLFCICNDEERKNTGTKKAPDSSIFIRLFVYIIIILPLPEQKTKIEAKSSRLLQLPFSSFLNFWVWPLAENWDAPRSKDAYLVSLSVLGGRFRAPPNPIQLVLVQTSLAARRKERVEGCRSKDM